jgi:triosephosphate isomerase
MRPLIAGNWKMHRTDTTSSWCRKLAARSSGGASLKAKDFNAIIRTLPFQATRAEHAAVA